MNTTGWPGCADTDFYSSGRSTLRDVLGPVPAAVDFTGRERDAETGLDFFQARYYAGAQGRFTSPDEFNGGPVDPFTGQQIQPPGPLPYSDIADPQSLNKYAYVLNNPLRYTDPNGHCTDGKPDEKGPCAPPPPPAPKNPVYPTPDQAAVAAARMNQQKQQQTGAEHASSVYTIGPAYTYTGAVTQGQSRSVDPNNTTGTPMTRPVDLAKAPIPLGTQLVGETHSHPSELPVAEGNFSGADIQRGHDMTLTVYGHPRYQGFYVGLPSGIVQKYDPFTGGILTFLPGASK